MINTAAHNYKDYLNKTILIQNRNCGYYQGKVVGFKANKIALTNLFLVHKDNLEYKIFANTGKNNRGKARWFNVDRLKLIKILDNEI